MRLLLLGAGGQLGSDIMVANAMRAQPFAIETLSRTELDVADVRAIPAALAARRFDVLINCTSLHKTDTVETQGDLAMAVNAHAPGAMAQAARKQGARLVHISTDYVFGGGSARAPLTEAAAPAPLNVYGASKLLGENLAFAAHDDVLVLRVASLFGVKGASGKGGNFVETMIRLGRERGQLRAVQDQVMSPTATADAAAWLLDLIEKNASPGLYHAVNSGTASWYEFAAAIISMTNVKARIEPVAASDFPTIALRPPYSALDNAKLAAVTGPIRDWGSALKDYLKAKGHCP